MEPEIITSRQGGAKLLYRGFIYHRRDSKKGRTYWNCQKRKECNATAITTTVDRQVEVVKFKEHSHAPNREEVEAEKVVNKLKRKATAQPELNPAQILRTELPALSDGVLSQLPERENLKKALDPARN